MENTYKFLFSRNVYIIIIIIIVSFVLYEITKKLLNGFIKKLKTDTRIANRKKHI